MRRKKSLYLGLLLSLLGIGNLTAEEGEYEFLFVNNTSYEVIFHVLYYGSWKEDHAVVAGRYLKLLKSNEQRSIEKIKAEVFDKFTSFKNGPVKESTTIYTQSFAPGHFTRDKIIMVVLGEPKKVYEIRHWQMPGSLKDKFYSNFGKGRFRFDEYIEAFGWSEDSANREYSDEDLEELWGVK